MQLMQPLRAEGLTLWVPVGGGNLDGIVIEAHGPEEVPRAYSVCHVEDSAVRIRDPGLFLHVMTGDGESNG